MRFIKKPIEVEAVSITPALAAGVLTDAPDWVKSAVDRGALRLLGRHIQVRTLEGEMIGRLGDWIIKGVAGEIYPCAEQIFAATYEPAFFANAKVQSKWRPGIVAVLLDSRKWPFALEAGIKRPTSPVVRIAVLRLRNDGRPVDQIVDEHLDIAFTQVGERLMLAELSGPADSIELLKTAYLSSNPTSEAKRLRAAITGAME